MAAKAGTLTFFEVRDTGLGTADPATAERHRSAGYEVTERIVESRTLTQLLSPYAGREVHWMKIDVEGLEREVIEGWDARLIRPWIVIVEATRPLTGQEAHDCWESLILARGYDFAFFDGLNRYYVSKDHGELLGKVSCPANVFDRFELSGGASNTFTKGLERRIAELARLETELASARESQASMQSELESVHQTVRERDAAIVRLESILAVQRREADRAHALETDINRLNNLMGIQQRDLEVAKAQLLATEKRLADRDTEIETVYRSKSWRLTKPLRSVSANFTKVFAALRAIF